MWPMRASARQSVACRPNKLIGPESEPNRPFFVGKQLPLPVSLRFTIITVSTSSTLATHRGQTSALTGTWTDSQTHLDNDFQYGLRTRRLIWTQRGRGCVEKQESKRPKNGTVICG